MHILINEWSLKGQNRKLNKVIKIEKLVFPLAGVLRHEAIEMC